MGLGQAPQRQGRLCPPGRPRQGLTLVLVFLLTIRPEQVETYRAYERQAAAVMARHGGGIERVVEIPSENEGGPYREVHIVSFPDEGAYQAYTIDPDMANWRALRDASVIRTEIMKGAEGPDYSPA